MPEAKKVDLEATLIEVGEKLNIEEVLVQKSMKISSIINTHLGET